MEDYQKRVVEEKRVLDKNIKTLTEFCKKDSKPYKNLIPDEKNDLSTQLSAMNIYSQALGRRIERFDLSEETKTED